MNPYIPAVAVLLLTPLAVFGIAALAGGASGAYQQTKVPSGPTPTKGS